LPEEDHTQGDRDDRRLKFSERHKPQA